VEVKSTTATNEEKQLRLALGQALRYRQLIEGSDGGVVGFIKIEQPPRDASWIDLCRDAGVRLVWPATVRAALQELI
jgi:hypothetical protein